ncbi:hypothetical protein MTO96_025257 [Rhipicephalus appendiculatus]
MPAVAPPSLARHRHPGTGVPAAPQTFPSARGLTNHERWHSDQEAAHPRRPRGSPPAANASGATSSSVSSHNPGARAPSPSIHTPDVPGPSLTWASPSASPSTSPVPADPVDATPPSGEAPPSGASPPSTSPAPLGTLSVAPSTSSASTTSSNLNLVAVEDDITDDSPEDTATDLPADHTQLFAEQVRALRAVLRSAPTEESWAQCEDVWNQAVALATEAVRLPPASSRRPPRSLNPANAADIQRLYRRNCRRAIRLILDGPS